MHKRKKKQKIGEDIAISVRNLTKTFTIHHENVNTVKERFLHPFRKVPSTEFEALKDVSFDIKKGEFVGIIGRNGSGKSTLLKILAGIYEPDTGEVITNGKIVPFLELGVGFNPELTARENVFLNGTILGMSHKYLEKKYNEIIEFAEVKEFEDMPLKNFSSGMYVRLAFAIAIQADADIYLLDEVLAVGDVRFQEKSKTKFKELIRQGTTVIYISHDLESIRKYCDKAMVLEKGEKLLFDTPNNAVNIYHQINLSKDEKSLGKIKILAKKTNNPKHNVQRWGNGKCKINSIEISDEQGEKKELLEYGNRYKITVTWDSTSTIPDSLNCGIGIYNDDDQYILGINTKMDKIEFYPNGKRDGNFILLLDDTKLLNGKYYLNVVLFDDDEVHPFDFIHKAKYFRITNSPPYRGLINLNHKWIINEKTT